MPRHLLVLLHGTPEQMGLGGIEHGADDDEALRVEGSELGWGEDGGHGLLVRDWDGRFGGGRCHGRGRVPTGSGNKRSAAGQVPLVASYSTRMTEQQRRRPAMFRPRLACSCNDM